MLMRTGRTGACGKMKRRGRSSGRGSSRKIGTKSQPSAPRPCSQMTVPFGSAPVASSMSSNGFNSIPRGTDGGLGAEGLYDLLARFDVGAADEIHAIRHRGEDSGHERLALGRLQALERLADRLGLARQVEDEALAANDAD